MKNPITIPMKVGLLWYDSGHDLTEIITTAARRHREKYDAEPTVCYVHPTMLSGNGKTTKVDMIRVLTSSAVLPHYFWIGVEKCQED